MADKKKSKKKAEEFDDPDEVKPGKEEYEVAKWLRNNVPTKKTKFLNHNVQYFTGKKAVDALMASTWGTSIKEGDEPFFSSRAHCIDFLDVMLRNKFFHRAKKVPLNEELFKGKKKGAKEDKKVTKEDKEKKKEKDKDEKVEKKKREDGESSHAEGKGQEVSENEEERQKKKKKKVRLDMHFEQYFADNLDAYVWIYEPVPPHYWLFGALVVMAGIGVCLFPLWPPSVRLVVYYLSIAAAGFLVFIVFLTVVRSIVFCLLWVATLGKHHLWLFPNLTEDVGFFASFWPLYKYEYKAPVETGKKKKKKKEKLSDNEDEGEGDDQKEEETCGPGEDEEPKEGDVKDEGKTTEEPEDRNEETGSESESSSQQSQTGKDFEIVDRAEIEAPPST